MVKIKKTMKYRKLKIDAVLVFDNLKQREKRYFLSYIWDKQKPVLGIIMFNPSNASEEKPDRTLARLINKFCNKYGGFEVINLISVINANPQKLPKNFDFDIIKHLKKLKTNNVLIAWGNLPKLLTKEKQKHLNSVIITLQNNLKNKDKYQLQENRQVHPLMREIIDLYPCENIALI